MTDDAPRDHPLVPDNLASLQSHVLAEETLFPNATGDFSWIISAISLAGKTIANKVRRARLDDVLGSVGTENVQGETQQKLDVIANEVLLRCLGSRGSIAVIASEEDEEPLILRTGSEGGKYCVLFDPLDGSSNLDIATGLCRRLHNDKWFGHVVPGVLDTLSVSVIDFGISWLELRSITCGMCLNCTFGVSPASGRLSSHPHVLAL